MKNGVFLASLLIVICAEAQALTSLKYDVYKTAKNYATSVACFTTFEKDSDYQTGIDDVMEVRSDDEFKLHTYYVLWGGDVMCSGGSGTWGYQLTEFSRYSNNRPYLVSNPDIFENADFFINTRFIESVKHKGGGVFDVVSSDFSDKEYGGEDGGSNFPANKFNYKIYINEGEAKLLNKQFLGRNH